MDIRVRNVDFFLRAGILYTGTGRRWMPRNLVDRDLEQTPRASASRQNFHHQTSAVPRDLTAYNVTIPSCSNCASCSRKGAKRARVMHRRCSGLLPDELTKSHWMARGVGPPQRMPGA